MPICSHFGDLFGLGLLIKGKGIFLSLSIQYLFIFAFSDDALLGVIGGTGGQPQEENRDD